MDFVRVDPAVFHPQENRLTAEFSRDKMYLWVDTSYFFTICLFQFHHLHNLCSWFS
jgi:hypothetical protein